LSNRMSNNETTTATLHDIEDGEIIEESSAADTMTLYEVDVMNLVKPMDLQQRYWFYCHKWHLAALPVDEIYSAIIEEVSQALMPSDEEELFVKTEEEETSHYWRVVDVDYGIASCVNLNTEQAETFDIRDLHLVFTDDNDQLIAEARAVAIHMYRFYANVVHRPWDEFSDAGETNFEPVLRRRLNLFGLDCDSLRHLHFRHDRDKAFFNNRLLELAGIRDVLERVSQEDKIYDRIYNDYLECYAICKVHASRLQKMEHELWHQYQIIKEGGQQIVRCKNGPRSSPNKTVCHVIGRNLTARQLGALELDDSCIIKTYDEEGFGEAIQNCFENDQVLLFPGVYSFDEHLFHEKITIRGCGAEPTDVVIQSEDGEGYFVFVDSEQLTLENLTLEGSRNFEGALVVNGGACHLNNVHIKCDPITRGIIVRPFASCIVNNVTITGQHACSVSLENASELIESGANSYAAPVRYDQLAPAVRRAVGAVAPVLGLAKLEEKVDQLEIGTKLASPRVDPTEGAGDIAA